MRRIVIVSALVFFALAAWNLPASAQTRNENWNHCADGNPDISIAGCTAVIQSVGQESNAGFAVAYYKRGDAYNQKSLYDKAVADESQSITLNPIYANAYGARGFAYEKLGQRDPAIADYRQALKLAADHPARYAVVTQRAQAGLQRLGVSP